MQDYNDSRSQGLGTAMTEPEQEAARLGTTLPAAAAAANGAAVPPPPLPTAHSASGGSETPADEGETSMASLLDNPSNAMHALQRGEVIEGTVARVDADEILVDIGQKSEGVISNRELGSVGENGALHVGQQVLVYVIQPESAEGHAVLSLKRARMEQSWRDAEQWMNDDRVIEAQVIDHNKGGLIVGVAGVRGFVPISQISELRGLAKGPDSGDSPQVAERLTSMRGRYLKLKIIELNRARNRLILSERLAMQEERGLKKEALLHELEPGQVRRGRVTSLASFGAFVDLGGADGLVHISQISYSRVNHPSEVLKVGDEVNVYVLSIDPQTKKIALSLKKAQPDPWTLVEERYKVGDVVEGTITKLAKFGAFARIDDGIEGLIHLSELSDQVVDKPQDVVNEGQEVRLRVLAINSQRRRLGLSLRQAQGDTLRPVELPAEFDDDVDVDDEPAAPTASGRSSAGSFGVQAPAPSVEAGTLAEVRNEGAAADTVAPRAPITPAPVSTLDDDLPANGAPEVATLATETPEVGSPLTETPEVGSPAMEPAATPAGSNRPEIGVPDTGVVETGEPQTAVPETGQPATGVAAPTASITGLPEPDLPDTGLPGAGVPEATGIPDESRRLEDA